MNDLRKAAQQALEALEKCQVEFQSFYPRLDAQGMCKFTDEAMDALEAALAQPEQLIVGGDDDLPTLTKWAPLEGEKLEAMYEDYVTHGDIVRAVEKAHGIGAEHD